MKKSIWLLFFAFLPSAVLAHSAVSPSATATSKYETFTLSVPTEKDIPTVGIRLVVPAGIDRFTPFVKPGWQIKLTRDADEKITEVEWTGGSIPNGQKDTFLFTARTAPEPTSLVWKVYQTYQNGEVVAWDQDPQLENVSNPYSITEVQDDSAAAKTHTRQNNFVPYIISIVALVISLFALRSAKNK